MFASAESWQLWQGTPGVELSPTCTLLPVRPFGFDVVVVDALVAELDRRAAAARDGTVLDSPSDVLELEQACRAAGARLRAEGPAAAALGPPLVEILAATPDSTSVAASTFGVDARVSAIRRRVLGSLRRLGADPLLAALAAVDAEVDTLLAVLERSLLARRDDAVRESAAGLLGDLALVAPTRFAETASASDLVESLGRRPAGLPTAAALRVLGVLACELGALPSAGHVEGTLAAARRSDDAVERAWARVASGATSDEAGPDPRAVAAAVATDGDAGGPGTSGGRYAAIEELALAGYVEPIQSLPSPSIRAELTSDRLSDRLWGVERLVAEASVRRSEPPPSRYDRIAVGVCSDALAGGRPDLEAHALRVLSTITAGGESDVPADAFPLEALFELVADGSGTGRRAAIQVVGELAAGPSWSRVGTGVAEAADPDVAIPVDSFVDALLAPGDVSRQAGMALVALAERGVVSPETPLPMSKFLDGLDAGPDSVRAAVVGTLEGLAAAGALDPSTPVEWRHEASTASVRPFAAWLAWFVETFRDDRCSAAASVLGVLTEPTPRGGGDGGDGDGAVLGSLTVSFDENPARTLPTGVLADLAGTGVLDGHVRDVLAGVRSRLVDGVRSERADAANRLAALARAGLLRSEHSLPIESLCDLVDPDRDPPEPRDPLAPDRSSGDDPATVAACRAFEAIAAHGRPTDGDGVELVVASVLDVLESDVLHGRTAAAKALRELARRDRVGLETLTAHLPERTSVNGPVPTVEPYLPDSREQRWVREFLLALDEAVEDAPTDDRAALAELASQLRRYLVDVDPPVESRVPIASILSRSGTTAATRTR